MYAAQNECQQSAHVEPRQRIPYSAHHKDLPETLPTEYKHRTAETKTWAEGKQRRMRSFVRLQRDREAFSEPAAGDDDHSIAGHLSDLLMPEF